MAYEIEHRLIPLSRRVRHRLGKVIGNYMPELLYYIIDKERRKGANIKRRGCAIDIMREDRIIRIARDNSVYVPLILENFDYFFFSADPVVARVEGDIVQLIDFSTPRLHRIHGFDDFPILCPSLTEPFVTTEQYLDFAQITPGQVVLDLGAYCGLSSIAFAQAVGPEGRVIAVEPDPLNHAACKANIAMAGQSQLFLVEAAVTAKPGMIELSSEGAMGSALASVVGAHRGEVVAVEGITLQGLAQRYQLERVDFIKMDIEGAEASVLPASVEFLKRYRPKLIIEPHLIDGDSIVPALRSLLESLGYRCALIEQLEYVTLPLLTATP